MTVRLLHITTVPETLGFLAGQPAYMRSRGFQVFAVSSPGPRLQMFAAQEQVPCRAVAMTRQISPLRDLASLGRLWRLFRRLRPDIVHAHTPKAGLLGMIAAWLAGVPLRIYHIHGLPLITAAGAKRAVLRCCERLSCVFSHQVLCVSRSLRQVVLDEGLCPPQKIKVLANGSINGIDAAGCFDPQRLPPETRAEVRRRYGIPPQAPLLGFVGRIVRDKGLAELCAAWRTLRAQFPELHWLVVGPFESQDPVPADVEALLRGDGRIHLAGEVTDMPPLYCAFDVVALPTYREGFPYVPLEAAAMGLPVVATRIPGCVEAVADGVSGTLVPPRDAEALTAALARYLTDPALCREHGAAGRRRVLQHFRPELLWEATCRQYRESLRARGLTRAADNAQPSAGSKGHALE